MQKNQLPNFGGDSKEWYFEKSEATRVTFWTGEQMRGDSRGRLVKTCND